VTKTSKSERSEPLKIELPFDTALIAALETKPPAKEKPSRSKTKKQKSD
jgi:hypothetical protein